MKRIIQTKNAPAAIGPYSQGVAGGGFLYISGQLGIDAESGQLAAGVEAQARRSLENIKAILAQAGITTADVVRTGIFLRDLHNFQKVNSIYAEFFASDYPARSTIEVSGLPRDAEVEIEAVALLRD